MPRSAPSSSQARHLSALPAVANTRCPMAVASWIAVTPMPEVPPCTSRVSPSRELGAVEHIRPNGIKGFRQRGRFDHGQALRHRQALRQRRRAILGIAAALHQRADHVALGEAAACQVAVDDLARHFQARQVGGARRHRIISLALEHVGPVDARRMDLDQHLAGFQYRRGPLAQLQDLGFARLGDFDCAHGTASLEKTTIVRQLRRPRLLLSGDFLIVVLTRKQIL